MCNVGYRYYAFFEDNNMNPKKKLEIRNPEKYSTI